jgi:HAD superfamily hydrolase (TIGR01509 family)
MRFEAVIFDMDGVLIDSEPLHFAALSSLLARDGVALSHAENEEFIGVTSQTMFSTLIARHDLPKSVADYMTLFDQGVLRVLDGSHPPQPGVVPLIAYARSLGMRLAVASSSRRGWIEATLRSTGLSHAFDVVVSGDDVESSKPDPQIYMLAAERLGVSAERCLAIEDSPNGVESAVRAGMTVLGVRTPYTANLQLHGVIRTVDSLADLRLSPDLVSC